MKKILSVLFLIAVLASCGGGGKKTDSVEEKGKGGRMYGGVFRSNETEYFRSLYPLNITEVVGHRITNQVYEGLVRLNQADLSVEPALAESWVVNENATRFTFKIRKGVKFHDDPCFESGKGRELTAHDFVYSFGLLCTPSADNQGFWLFKDLVTGANALYQAREKKEHDADEIGAWGVKALDDYTLEVSLDKPFAAFLYRLAMPFCAALPQEAVKKYGEGMREKCVGTGPFVVSKVLHDEAVILKRNEGYWGKDESGNQLPFLDGIRFSFIKEEKVEMLEFRKGNLDMKYRLPLDAIQEILDEKGELKGEYKKFQAQKVTELSTQFYGYLHYDKVFSNKHVRRAFNYAIDREAIVNYTVKGEGSPAIYGMVPLGMAGYNNEAVVGFRYDPAIAKQELAQGGYPDGKGFPKVTLQINSGGGRNEKVAEAIQKMLKETLNVDVEITQLPFAQHLENLETGKAQFWRLGWNADYPDPENFLNLFYGKHLIGLKPTDKSYLNSYRYNNPAFDALLEKANATVDFKERNKIYEQADQLAMEDAVIMPIYYSVNRRLLQNNVKNYPANGMEYRLLREVWFDPPQQVVSK